MLAYLKRSYSGTISVIVPVCSAWGEQLHWQRTSSSSGLLHHLRDPADEDHGDNDPRRREERKGLDASSATDAGDAQQTAHDGDGRQGNIQHGPVIQRPKEDIRQIASRAESERQIVHEYQDDQGNGYQLENDRYSS